MRVTFERNDCSLIFLRANDAFDETARGSFFVRQCSLFRNAYVDDERYCQRPISLALKSKDALRDAVFDHANIVLLKRGDITIALVSRGEKQVSEIGFSAENVNIIRRRRSLRRAGCRRLTGSSYAERDQEEKNTAN